MLFTALLATLSAFGSAFGSYEPQALTTIVARAKLESRLGHRPVVVFDVDDTLTDTRTRTARILRELGREPDVRSRFPDAAEKLARLSPYETRFTVEQTLASAGLSDPELVQRAKAYWLERFFTGEYAARDAATAHAPAYVRRLERAGAFVVYLTGRDAPRLEAGTRASFERLGFPLDENTELLMKPDRAEDDRAFKARALEHVAGLGSVIGVFENEPRNINLLARAFPSAQAVFVDSIHSDAPDQPDPDVAWVRDFAPPAHEPYEPGRLREVLEGVRAARAAGEVPVVIFDLDETLINSRTRVLRILGDLFSDLSPRLRELARLDEADLEGLAYDLRAYPLDTAATLRELGAYTPALDEAIRERFTAAYLSNDYCALDAPMPGAARYARAVHDAGARVVYLTGRNRPHMGRCTEENLRARGFPFGDEDETLLMKPRPELDDTEFKRAALGEIARLGRVVAGFENEPANVNAFKQAFPDGLFGYVDDTHSRRTDRPEPGIFWIRDFRGPSAP